MFICLFREQKYVVSSIIKRSCINRQHRRPHLCWLIFTSFSTRTSTKCAFYSNRLPVCCFVWFVEISVEKNQHNIKKHKNVCCLSFAIPSPPLEVSVMWIFFYLCLLCFHAFYAILLFCCLLCVCFSYTFNYVYMLMIIFYVYFLCTLHMSHFFYVD